MKIKKNNLVDLYRRFINFISSNYPDALIIENENNVVITYPGELGRIIILQDQKENLIVKMILCIGEKINNKNSKTFYLSTIDELNCLKTAVQIVMEMQGNNETSIIINEPQKALKDQGYLADKDQNIIGIVDLSLIPTNAFIKNTDIINQEEEEIEEVIEKPKEKTIMKFFKR